MGAAERWLASLIGAGFPYGTLTVNVVGSFILGALVQGLAVSFDAGEVVQRFLFVGLLGGFTTFSAFSADSIAMLERGDVGRALLYIALSVVLSVGGFYCGLKLVRGVL
ncbi:Putative fluoride ion transporter CrcB [Geodia barretti]|uniref:Fluoride ion transporter CrcB n=1 Tax=Geodia barretti TaxID=519541 RepID=A0AA35XHB0_GEOBA|nr:Putative fluoride ion transporter CrcB [Geodia barretti]